MARQVKAFHSRALMQALIQNVESPSATPSAAPMMIEGLANAISIVLNATDEESQKPQVPVVHVLIGECLEGVACKSGEEKHDWESVLLDCLLRHC